MITSKSSREFEAGNGFRGWIVAGLHNLLEIPLLL